MLSATVRSLFYPSHKQAINSDMFPLEKGLEKEGRIYSVYCSHSLEHRTDLTVGEASPGLHSGEGLFCRSEKE